MPARAPTPPPVPRAHPPTPNEPNLQAFARGTEQSPVEQAVTTELQALEDKLDRALSTLTMHYQPIVRAVDRTRFGYEALLRTTDKSLPHPGAVLDAAERLEKIQKLGRAVRGQIAQRFAAEPTERGVVFLNLHLLDLHDKQLTSSFAPLSKIASRVTLEITERTSLDGQADIRYRVAELRELGFKIAIDDLGGGHARMGEFTLTDTDFVKLDMSLVRDIDRQPMKQRLAKSITEMCRDHGAKVIGEGVETEAEAQTLVDLGCDLLQGYFIARPALPFCDPL
jgi:EAL domain-containing protein (putative c-di-GMP-specific phosphodiesterase class I)